MKETKVRICEIHLKGFKNTRYGVVTMPSASKKLGALKIVDILGIYGQNGSGKTAVIEAMDFIQGLLIGDGLSSNLFHYISKEEKECSIKVTFLIETPEKRVQVGYEVRVVVVSENKFQIEQESLTFSRWNGKKFEPERMLIYYDTKQKNGEFLPKYRYQKLIRHQKEYQIDLGVAKKLGQKEHRSFLFSGEGKEIFSSAPEEVFDGMAFVIHVLSEYANYGLFVISRIGNHSRLQSGLLPLVFFSNKDGLITKGRLFLRLDQPTFITEQQHQLLCQMVNQMNVVLVAMIPGFSIEIYDLGKKLFEDGSLGYQIELISKRGQVKVPLQYESEGILKIISILNVLVGVYNHDSICLLIDELDAGIYEYLLGEILTIFQKGAKGQLIFTSHNLRALEMLRKECILFSTVNKDERYLRLKHAKRNYNLREMYLRSIVLGGQKQEVSEKTDSIEIGRAFRRA